MKTEKHESVRRSGWDTRGLAPLALCFLFFCAAAGRTDLEIEEIRFRPERPLAGTPLAVYAMIRNSGSEAVRNIEISVTLLQSGKNLKTISSIPVLSELPRAGAGLSLPVELGMLPEGDYQVRLAVDPAGKILENNESNNEKTALFHVYESAYASAGY